MEHASPSQTTRGPVRRVLVLAKDFPPMIGGGPVLNRDLCLTLHRLGYEIRVITWTAAGEFRDDWPFSLERIAWADDRTPCPAQRVPQVIAEFQPDAVIVSPTSKYLSEVFAAVRRSAIPYLVYCHFLRIKHTERMSLQRFFARRRYGYQTARLVAGVSGYLVEQLKKVGVPSERLRVLYPGVDPVRFRPDAAQREEMRRKWDLQDRIVILTVARLIEGKGQEKVIRALPKLVAEFPKALYLVVGGGPSEESFRQLTRELGVQDHVRFVGPKSDPQPFYPASDLFVLASDKPGKWLDTFGLTLVEAGASGVPVIASSVGGPPEIIQDGRTGLLIDPRSPDALLAALRRLCADRALRESMGVAARERVSSTFSHEQSAAQLRGILEEMMSSS